MKIEVCVESLQVAIAAQKAGVHRIELCANLAQGGTTPSIAMIELARQYLDIELMVMIRPSGGDFYYNDLEFELMCRDIERAKQAGADGLVFGLLSQNGELDFPRTQQLVSLSKPLQITFHRAFDRCINPEKAIRLLVDLGIDRLLTSGRQPTAWQGRDYIQKLVKEVGNQICIMPGSGVDPKNIVALAQQTKAKEFHFSAAKLVASQACQQAVFMGQGVNNEFMQRVFDPQKVEGALLALKNWANKY